MPQTAPLTRQQQWLYRHRRAVRIACVIVLVLFIGQAVHDFAHAQAFQGVVAVLLCGSPLGIIGTTRSLDQTVALRAGRDARR